MSDPQITVPFAGGPDETIDPRSLPPGSVISALNQVYDADGAYVVRYGVTMLPSGPSSVFRLAVFASELLAIAALGVLWSCSPSDNAFVQRDTMAAVSVTHASLFNATGSFGSWGEAIVGNYRVVAYQADTTDVNANIYDLTTGALVSKTTLGAVSNVAGPVYVGAVGTTAVVTGANATNIVGFTIDLSSTVGSWSVGTNLDASDYNLGNSNVYAAAFTATRVYIAYEVAGSSPSTLKVRNFPVALTSPTTGTTTLAGTSHGLTCISMEATNGENVWVAFVASTSSYTDHTVMTQWTTVPAFTQAYSMTPASNVTSAHVTRIGIARMASNQVLAAMSSDPPSGEGTSYTQFRASFGQVGLAMGVFGVALASNPIALNSTAYCYMFSPYVGLQNPGTYFLVDLIAGTTGTAVMPSIQAVLAPSIVNIAGEGSGGFAVLPPIVQNGANYETVMPIVSGAAGRQGIELFTFETATMARLWSGGETLGKEAYFGGSYYDGERACEIGFPIAPLIQSLTNISGTGNTYDYCVTFARVDRKGNIEESAPSPVNSVTSGSSADVTVLVDSLWLTNKQRLGQDGQVGVLVYRTQKTSSGDTLFYRVNKDPISFFNSQTATSVSYTDTLSDAALTDGTHPVLYTISGELAHNAPETPVASCVHKLRRWQIGADQRTIWYSQTYSDSFVPSFSDVQQITVDDAGEPLIALASLYDKLLIFTRSRIYVVFGDGPSIAGTGNDLTTPQRVPSAAGCIDPRSIVNTPLGVMFQSQRGLEVIGTDLSVQFIGQPVSTTTKTFPICVGAVFVESSSTVRFAMTNSEAYPNVGAGAVVLYDIRRGRWAVHQITNIVNSGPPPYALNAPMQACTLHQTLGWVGAYNDSSSPNAYVFRENTTADATPWLDFGAYFVPLSVTTAWIKTDLQGWQSVRRVRVLAQYFDQHQLSIALNYDYQQQREVHSWSDTVIAGIASVGWEQFRAIPTQRRCEAIQVTIATSAPATNAVGTGRGAGFTGLSFEVRAQKGGYRRFAPTAQT
jgi:hypothetical protein